MDDEFEVDELDDEVDEDDDDDDDEDGDEVAATALLVD